MSVENSRALLLRAATCLALAAIGALSMATAQEEYPFERMWPSLKQDWYFGKITGADFGPDGLLYILDGGIDRVYKYHVSGHSPDNWPLQLPLPELSTDYIRGGSLSVGPDGSVYLIAYAMGSGDDVHLGTELQQYTSSGTFVRGFPAGGSPTSSLPKLVASPDGSVYMCDGTTITRFDSELNETTEGPWFDDFEPGHSIIALDVDSKGTVFALSWNGMVYRITADGIATNWPILSQIDGSEPTAYGLTVGSDDNLYVTLFWDYQLYGRDLQAYSQSGLNLPNQGFGLDQEDNVYSIIAAGPAGSEAAGRLYVRHDAYPSSPRLYGNPKKDWISVHELAGPELARWTPSGTPLYQPWGEVTITEPGRFGQPGAIAIDPITKHVYVADAAARRIQRFTPSGSPEFFPAFGGELAADGSLGFIMGLGVSPDGTRVYVADAHFELPGPNVWIKVFDSSGTYLDIAWPTGLGFEDGWISADNGWANLAVDIDGNVYVAFGPFVEKYSDDGTPSGNIDIVEATGTLDSYFVEGIATPTNEPAASNPSVYIVTGNTQSPHGELWELNSDLTSITDRGQVFAEVPQENGATDPSCLAVLLDGSLQETFYVGFANAGYVREFDHNLNEISTIGSRGTLGGSTSGVASIALTDDGDDLYVSDAGNARVVKRSRLIEPSNARAIIVAGGGPSTENFENKLWDATQYSANFAYRTLTVQGLTKDRIYYLSPNVSLDLDQNGQADEVNNYATLANIQFAMENLASWGPPDTPEDVVVFLVDHGAADTFLMNDAEKLDAVALAGWLNTLQSQITGTLTIIYDACQSGSFLSALAPTGGERIVITSATGTENAHFLGGGALSFSTLFWTGVFDGADVSDAFDDAVAGLSDAVESQTPQLIESTFGLSQGKHIGMGVTTTQESPIITGVPASVSTLAGMGVASLSATATDPDGVDKVWAVILPPNFSIDPDSANNPVTELPAFELLPSDTTPSFFEGSFDGFKTPGIYDLAVFARDGIGNVSPPKFTHVNSDSSRIRRGILINGAAQTDPRFDAYQAMTSRARKALLFQNYEDVDIDWQSAEAIAGVDRSPSYSQLQFLLTNSIAKDITFDLVLYLTGEGDGSSFPMYGSNPLTPPQLASWLNSLQSNVNGIPGTVTVVLDFDQAGAWVPVLSNPPPGRERYVLASSLGTQRADFEAGGQVSFSNYFWTRVLNGANLRDAFRTAEVSMRFAAGGQEATFDDNGNGIPDEPIEGNRMKRLRIGAGIQLAGEDPVGGTVPVITAISSGSTTVQVDGITSTDGISQVTATVTPPYPTFLASFPAVPMTSLGGGSYAVTLNGFDFFGPYVVSAVARDMEGNVGLPVDTIVKRVNVTDAFEPDDAFTTAAWIGLDGPAQLHGFHNGADTDWVAFGGTKDTKVTIRTSKLGSTADTVLTLYGTDGTTPLGSDDDGGSEDNASLVYYTLPGSGVYYVRVTPGPEATSGADSEYTVSVNREIAPVLSPGQVGGLIKVAGSMIDVPESGLNIMLQGTDCVGVDQNCYVQTDDPHISVQPDGRVYAFALDTGPYRVDVSAPGFQSAMLAGTLQAGSALELSFQLTDGSPQNATTVRNQFTSKDADGNGSLSLSESGLTPTMFNILDLNHDGSITLAELLEATVGPTDITDPVYVDFAYAGDENGTDLQPFNTLAEAAAYVAPGGNVIIQAGTTSEKGKLNSPMKLNANGGMVRVGN